MNWKTEIRILADNVPTVQSVVGALNGDEKNQKGIWKYHRIVIPMQKEIIKHWIEKGINGIRPFVFKSLISPEVAASIFQVPSSRLRISGLKRNPTRRAPAIGVCRDESIGAGVVKDEKGLIVIPEIDRKYNVLCVGKQGTGKTTILKKIAISDVWEDKAVIIIDPKNDFADEIRHHVPEGRPVAYWRVGDDSDWGLNLFSQETEQVDLAVDEILSGLKLVFGKESIGPRSEMYLRNFLTITYLYYPGKGWNMVYNLLANPALWAEILDNVKDDYLHDWLLAEIDNFQRNAKFASEVLAAPRNKINAFVSTDKMRRVFAPQKTINIESLIQDKGILIVNLNDIVAGEQNAAAIGIFLLMVIWNAIRKVNLGAEQRIPLSLIVDESHRFTTDTVKKMLAEGRAYGIQSAFGLQFLQQIQNEDLQLSLVELMGTKFQFNTKNPKNAEEFAKQIGKIYVANWSVNAETSDKVQIGPDDIQNLPNYHCVASISKDGAVLPAFVAQTIPANSGTAEEREKKIPSGTCPKEWLVDCQKDVKEDLKISFTPINPEIKLEELNINNRAKELIESIGVSPLKIQKLLTQGILEEEILAVLEKSQLPTVKTPKKYADAQLAKLLTAKLTK